MTMRTSRPSAVSGVSPPELNCALHQHLERVVQHLASEHRAHYLHKWRVAQDVARPRSGRNLDVLLILMLGLVFFDIMRFFRMRLTPEYWRILDTVYSLIFAVNAALLKLRSNWAGRAFLDDGIDECENVSPCEMSKWQGPQERHTREELTHILDQAMRSLELTERAVFVLRDIEEMSTEDTAQALNLPVPVVKRRLLKARLQLREELTGRFKEQNDARAAEVGRGDA